jgi:hypothetical protein
MDLCRFDPLNDRTTRRHCSGYIARHATGGAAATDLKQPNTTNSAKRSEAMSRTLSKISDIGGAHQTVVPLANTSFALAAAPVSAAASSS